MTTLHPQALRCFQVVLVVLCGIFSGYTLYELVRPYGLSPAALSTGQDALAMSEIQPRMNRSVLPPEAFSEIVERPLFRENRRPFVPEARKAPERPSQAEPDIEISLSAIVIADDERIAIIKSKRDRKLKKLRQGETFNGWTLTDVQTHHIAMQKGLDTRQIELTMKPSRHGSRELQEAASSEID